IVIIGFEVELQTTAGFQGESQRLVQQPGVHRAVWLPTDSYASPRQDPGSLQSVQHLGRGIPTEVADTEGARVGLVRQFLRPNRWVLWRHVPVLPVLAEEAGERARPIETRQIVVPVPLPALADRVRHAGRGQS